MSDVEGSRDELVRDIAALRQRLAQLEHQQEQSSEQAQVLAAANEALHKSGARQLWLVQNLRVGLAVHAPDGTLEFSNDEAARILGLSTEQMQGKALVDPAWRFVREDGSALPPGEYPAARIMASLQSLDALVIGVDRPATGDRAWVLVRGYPQLGPQRELRCVVVTFDDITERKRTEAALRESEGRLQRAHRAARMGNWEWDLATNELYWAPENYLLHGLDPQKVQPSFQAFLDLVDPAEREFINRSVADALAGTSDYALDYTVTRPADGSRRVIHTQADVIRDAAGKAVKMVGTVQDVTEHRRTEALVRARLQLQERALTGSLKEILQSTLDEAEHLTGSLVGFYHFVEADQRTLSLQAWSTRTAKGFCAAVGAGRHYDVDAAGVWADCVRQRRPVIHNDYATLPYRKGLPEGHAPLIRELVVPILRSGSVVAVLGVGNKSSDYTDDDVSTITELADQAWNIAERKRVEDQLREANQVLRNSEYLFRESQRAAFIGSYKMDFTTDTWESSEVLDQIFGIDRSHARTIAGWLDIVYPDDRAVMSRYLQDLVVAKHQPFDREYRITRQTDRETRWVHGRGTFGLDPDGKLVSSIGTIQDITERKRVEAENAKIEDQLRQAQKVEVVGRLAGGIAHDFNNILAAMTLELNMLRLEPQLPPEELTQVVDELLASANRAANLTKQLLLFSRQQPMKVATHDLNALIIELTKLLRRLLGEHMTLAVALDREPLWVEGDASMLEQVVTNLCINARDAMPQGGRLTVATLAVDLDAQASQRHRAARPGQFVCLRVSDAGRGMDAGVLEHIFEPFFTTKEPGVGTGIGLATVQGIVAKHGGWIEARSWVGQGSTFDVYLPRAPSSPASKEQVESVVARGRDERVLVVEDEAPLRAMTVRCLRQLGYRVTEAANGVEALTIWDQQAGAFDLLFTDMVMPEGVSGLELCTRLRQTRADLKTIIVSGYSAEILDDVEIATRGITYLPKPFDRDTLAAAVRACLDRTP